jgi:AraC-like DNA-binding protein
MATASEPTSRSKRRRSVFNSVPVAYPRLLIELAEERGLAASDVLSQARVREDLLEQPDARVTAAQAAAMTRYVIDRAGCEGIGIEIGLRAKPTVHGYLGYAALSSGTAGEAFALFAQFGRLRSGDFSLVLSVDGDQAVVDVRENHPLGKLRHTLYEGVMSGFVTLGRHIFGAPIEGVELCFEWPEPGYFEPYRWLLPLARFQQPSNQIRFPAELLSRRLPMGDPMAVKTLLKRCEQELAELGPVSDNLLARLRGELAQGEPRYADLETIAARLFMSGRTLKRRLAEVGTNFQQLRDEVRYREAQRLLANPELDLAGIAQRLGYLDPAHFTRAFRRWSGRTPSAERAELSQG